MVCLEGINLEHMHARDVLITHKSVDLIMGIHGSHILNSVFGKPGSQVLEFMPANGPGHTTNDNWKGAFSLSLSLSLSRAHAHAHKKNQAKTNRDDNWEFIP